MKRQELLKSREYWIADIQLKLFELIEQFMKDNNINRTQLATKLGVTKSYISQVLNGDFDHKVSKMVDLALACNAMPIINFKDVDEFIGDEICRYDIPYSKPVLNIHFNNVPSTIKNEAFEVTNTYSAMKATAK